MRQAGEVQHINNQNAVHTFAIGEGLKALKYNEKKAKYELVVTLPSSGSKQPDARSDISGSTRPNLRQRSTPCTPNQVASVLPDSQHHTSGILDHLEAFGTKVWSAIGFTNTNSTGPELPPGLNSISQKTCFVNSVLQCLSHVPNLADDLAEEMKSCRSQDARRLALLDAVTELLQQLNEIPSQSSTRVVKTNALCAAGIYAECNIHT